MAVGIIATLRVVDGKQAEFEAGFAKMQEVVKAEERGVCSMPCVKTRRTPQPIGLWNNMQMKMREKPRHIGCIQGGGWRSGRMPGRGTGIG